MFILNEKKLKIGDIILTRSDDAESERIRTRSGSEFSHAMLYQTLSSVVESDGDGVHANNIQRKIFNNSTDAVLLRVKDEHELEKIKQAVAIAKTMIGTDYSAKEAIRAISMESAQAIDPLRQYCTRYVAQSFKEAGIQLVRNAAYCTPEELLNSPELEIDRDVLKAASKAHLKLIETESIVQPHKDTTNYILENMRNSFGEKIQSLENVYQFVLDNPDKETEVLKITTDSGYLESWQLELDKNSYRYDIKLFYATLETVGLRLKHAVRNIEVMEGMLVVHREMLKNMRHCFKFYNQKYFQKHIELYENLIRIENDAIAVGNMVLNKTNWRLIK